MIKKKKLYYVYKNVYKLKAIGQKNKINNNGAPFWKNLVTI